MSQTNFVNDKKEMTVDDTSSQYLRDAVLAENIEIHQNKIGQEEFPGMVDITFDFLCRNCGKRHWATEIGCRPAISVMGISLKCGWVSIRMPWANTPPAMQRVSMV